MSDEKIGKISHYFNHINVAGINILAGSLNIGDTIHIKGHTTDFTQKIDSMQIDNKNVESAKAGDKIGIKTKDKVREHDEVFKVLE